VGGEPGSDEALIELRHPYSGKLVCKYDPATNRLQFRERGETFWLDIDALHAELDQRLRMR
jgi:hypothetical protein